MNCFIFTGNLGQDAEVKNLPSGTTLCSFSVAVKSGYGDNIKTSWPRCTIFGKRAEGGLPQRLKKGAQVCISGELSLDEWQGQDGTVQKMLSVNVREIDLIGGKQDSQQSAPQQQNAPQQAPQGMDSFDDDIPF